MVGVPRGGDGADDDDAAPPVRVCPPSDPTSRVPATVVDLAQRGEHLGAGVVVHRQDRRDVLDDQQAALADLAQQPAGGVGGALPSRGRRQQRGVAGDRTGDDGTDAVECLHGLGLGVGGPGDDQQPDRVASVVELLDRSGGEHGVEGVGVVVLAEPAVEDGVRPVQGDRRDRLPRRLGCRRWLLGTPPHPRLVRLDQAPQVLDGVPGHQVVVQAGLVIGVGQVQELDPGTHARQVGGQGVGRLLHRLLARDVAVECDDNTATVQGDAAELGQRHLAAGGISPKPVPHTGQGDDAQPVQRPAVGLLGRPR